MVPQEFSLMRKTKGTDATLQWRKEKKNNAGDQEVIKAWIQNTGCYHVYLYSQLGQQPFPKHSSCNAAQAQLWLQAPLWNSINKPHVVAGGIHDTFIH